MENRNIICGLLVCCSLLLVSCGGGGSDSSTPPPPVSITPPPVTNTAPTIQFTILKEEVYENEVFTIDANDSFDSEGGIAEINITQVVGTSGLSVVALENTNFGRFNWRSPNPDVDIVEELVFEIEVTDDQGAKSTATANVLFRGFPGTGYVAEVYDPALDLKVGNGQHLAGGDLVGVVPRVVASRPVVSNSQDQEILILGSTDDELDFSINNQFIVNGIFNDVSYVDYPSLFFQFDGSAPGEEFTLLSEDENKLYWYVEDFANNPNSFDELDNISIEKPCHVVGRTDTGTNLIWVGQRNNGVSIINLESVNRPDGVVESFDDTLIQNISTERSLCYIFPTVLPERIDPPDFSDDFLPDFIAVDYDSNELVLFADSDEDRLYEELTTIALETNSSNPLNIVSIVSSGNPSLSPKNIAILLSDGNHIGNHRLIFVTQDILNDNEISQQVFSWNEGIPVALLRGNFGGENRENQFLPDLVVVRSTSSQSLFFNNIRPPEQGVGDHPIYAQPVTFDLEMGATSAVTITSGDLTAKENILVSYGENGQIRVFDPNPD